MRLLLDTHIFLWFISGDARLPADWRDSIRDGGNEVYWSIEHLVPEAALEALADQNIPFTVKGKTTYEQQMAAIRGAGGRLAPPITLLKLT
jgi:hypothetical protein